MPCEHKPKSELIRDIFIVIGLIFLFFVFREVFAWFCKGNHTLGVVRSNQERLLTIENMLRSLTE